MLFKLRITTVSEMTIEADSLSLAEGKRQYYLDDINSHSHHGERSSIELLVPAVIDESGGIPTITVLGDEALRGAETKWATISLT